ncbi:MAG: DUF721 domain-containing protein [Bacteroidetes bacterium]|nr:MAG: DUF721 domain-containing protein [Bacteroidota bacterium]
MKAIGDLLQAFFSGRLAASGEPALREVWLRLTGPEVAASTQALTLRRGTLTAQIDDPLLRQELMYRVEELALLFRQAGFPEVRRVRIR